MLPHRQQSAFEAAPHQSHHSIHVAASTLPYRGPKRGRKCYITHQGVGKKETTRAGQVLNFWVGSSKQVLHSMGGGGGSRGGGSGGGVGVNPHR